MPLLRPDEPAPVTVLRADGASPFVLACDHASRRIPQALGTLGLPEPELARHIAWDIGAAGVTRQLAALLDATAVLQEYSRLVIDCNRRPDVATSIVRRSEATDVPGNASVTPADAAARRAEIFTPYHDAIRALLDSRESAARAGLRAAPVLVCVHSFTPVYLGDARPMHAGVLFNRDARFARPVLQRLRADRALVVGENTPYSMGDDSDYTAPVHGEQRGLPHVMLEIRQDLVADEAGEAAWARRLAGVLRDALADATSGAVSAGPGTA